MAGPIPIHIRIVRAIDRFTDLVGTLVAWLNLPLVLVVAYEVIMRYLFDSPTAWVFDMTYMLYAAIFMLGASYALHKGAHIRTDFYYEKWSIRTRGTIDAVAYIVFFFPALITLLIVGADQAWYSYSLGETSDQTPWRAVLWPFRAVVPLTMLLLLVQGVSETIKCVYAARTGIELEHKEKIEV